MALYALKDVTERLNILQGDHEALLEKHRKLSLNTQSLVDRVSLAENGQKIAENKYNKLVGKVRQAKSKIITLNSNTPYRPGAVERTLRDIEEGLKNV